MTEPTPENDDGPQDVGDNLVYRSEGYVAEDVQPEPDQDDAVDVDIDGVDDQDGDGEDDEA